MHPTTNDCPDALQEAAATDHSVFQPVPHQAEQEAKADTSLHCKSASAPRTPPRRMLHRASAPSAPPPGPAAARRRPPAARADFH
jgi:hypothetical protein